MRTAASRDPRSVVTPDAFEVASSLLGLPLATPGRRAVALAIDGMVIGLITALTKNFGLILGIVAAVVFVRAGFKRTPVRGSVFDRAMRMSVGCLGVVIAITTASVWVAIVASGGSDRGDDTGPGVAATREGDGAGRVVTRLLERMGIEFWDGVASPQEARARAEGLVGAGRELGVDDDALRRVLLARLPEDAPWADTARLAVDEFLRSAPAAPEATTTEAVRADIEAYSDEEAARAWADLMGQDPAAEGVAERRALLEARLAPVIAEERIDRLDDRVDELERELVRSEGERRSLESELAEARSRGWLDRLADLADTIGFGFGWGALYMTIMLSWWNGQTVGKRVMKIRVLRLDGEPINWWVAFERAGGYAAGLATGLLGFAQVWWDANRQMIHDRIVGTVVVMDGAEKVLDWESVL